MTSSGAAGGRTWWADVLAGPPRPRAWLLDVELAWYGLILAVILAGHAAGYTAPRAVEFFGLAATAVLCALAAVVRWWEPGWTGAITLAVLAVGLVVLLVLPVGPLGAMRLMLSVAVDPVLLAAAVRRCTRTTAVAAVLLALAQGALDVGLRGTTLSVVVSRALIGTVPPRPVVILTAALLVLVPVALGLLLRSVDTAARAEALARVRADERLQVARELHDLVANHVTGMIVTAQAAELSAQGATGAALRDIEDAGNRALGAMRRMVGTLRSAEVIDLVPAVSAPPVAATTAWRAVAAAIDGDERVVLHPADAESGVPAPVLSPEVATTVQRIVTEALTNARRHMPAGSLVEIHLGSAGSDVLTLDVVNRRSTQPTRVAGGGHGLVGLRERALAVGGRLDAGPDGERWRVHAELPC